MPRPLKCRRVAFIPGVTYFKPAGIPMRSLGEVQLSLEEAEALRLKDLEGMEQAPASERMNVSRPTFQRVLASARRKVADALLNGKAVRIAGGNFEMASYRFRCGRGHEWDVPFGPAAVDSPALCPTCNTPGVRSLLPAGTDMRGKGGGRRRLGRGR
jgi:predicted DNA-binding protein (UPF0251 family)